MNLAKLPPLLLAHFIVLRAIDLHSKRTVGELADLAQVTGKQARNACVRLVELGLVETAHPRPSGRVGRPPREFVLTELGAEVMCEVEYRIGRIDGFVAQLFTRSHHNERSSP